MSLSTGDLLQFTDVQDYLGEQVLNVYFYRWFSAPTTDNTPYEALVDSFQDRIVNGAIGLQNSLLTHTGIQLKNLSNGVDFHEKSIAITGATTVTINEAMPSSTALTFKLIRDSLVTRNGSKRISGLRDSQVKGNDYIELGSEVGDFGLRLLDFLNVGLIDVAAPIIVKRPIVVPAGTSYVYSSIVDTAVSGVGTQNTRKQGRGA